VQPVDTYTLGRTASHFLLRVRPEELAHETLLAGLAAIAVDFCNLLEEDTVLADGRTAVNDKVALLAVGAENGGLGALGLEARRGLGCGEEGGEGNCGLALN